MFANTVLKPAFASLRTNLPFVAIALVPLVALKALAVSEWKARTALAVLAEVSVPNLAILLFASGLSLLALFLLNLNTLLAQFFASEGRYLPLVLPVLFSAPIVAYLYASGSSIWFAVGAALSAPLGALTARLAGRSDLKRIRDTRTKVEETRVRIETNRRLELRYMPQSFVFDWKNSHAELEKYNDELAGVLARLIEVRRRNTLSSSRYTLAALAALFMLTFVTSPTPWLAPQKLDIQGQPSISGYVLNSTPAEVTYLDYKSREVKRIASSRLLGRQYCGSETQATELAADNPPTPICPA